MWLIVSAITVNEIEHKLDILNRPSVGSTKRQARLSKKLTKNLLLVALGMHSHPRVVASALSGHIEKRHSDVTAGANLAFTFLFTFSVDFLTFSVASFLFNGGSTVVSVYCYTKYHQNHERVCPAQNKSLPAVNTINVFKPKRNDDYRDRRFFKVLTHCKRPTSTKERSIPYSR